jgi:NADH dehydrogenase (ubiquinone) Fe-S protein 1
MIRGPDGRFKAVTWRDALAVVAEVLQQVKPEEITGVAGKLSDAESMMALKDFVNRMGSDKVLCEGNGPNPPADLRSNYLMNTSIAGLEKADVFLLVGTQVEFYSFSWLLHDAILITFLAQTFNFTVQLASIKCC